MGTPGLTRILAGVAAGLLTLAAVSCSSSDTAGSKDEKATTTTQADGTTATAGRGDAGAPLKRYAGYETVNYGEAGHWVCRPDADDICDHDLDATVIEADGSLTEEPFEAAADPPIDCFYVYPTISRDETTYSDWDASDDEEGYVTLNQAARLQSQCRLFAPVYRQMTLTSLTSRLAGGSTTTTAAGAAEAVDPYADVLDAFRTYMAEDNGGRGVVLIGHSQGASMLNRLIAEEIDPNDDVRSHLVSAYLAGWSVAVPEGKDVGGSFQQVPVCAAEDQTGCVVTWVSFRSTAPPPSGSFFGKARAGASLNPGDQPVDQVAACANPADLGGSDVELHSYFPANNTASILSDLGTSTEAAGWVDPPAGEITTPFVSVPGLVTGSCATADGYHFLSVTVHGDPTGPRADDIPGDLTPEWGLHLVDVNLVMGDVVDLVAAQAEAYAG